MAVIAKPKIIQLKNKKGEKLYPIIDSDYCIDDNSIKEEKLRDDVKTSMVIELQDTGETSSEKEVYKPTDDGFISKINNYYNWYGNGKPFSFLFTPKPENNISKYYHIPVKQFTYDGRSGNYYLYGRNGDYSVECTVEKHSNSVVVYVEKDSINNIDIASGAIKTDNIDTEAVTTSNIADNCIITPKLADQVVTTAKLADGAVTVDKLANGKNYLMKDNLQKINVNWQIDVDTSLDISSIDTLKAAYSNMGNSLPVTFKVASRKTSAATVITIYSSSGYYSSTLNKSTSITTYTIGTYFRVVSMESAVYKLEISWKSDTTDVADATITIEAV